MPRFTEQQIKAIENGVEAAKMKLHSLVHLELLGIRDIANCLNTKVKDMLLRRISRIEKILDR